MAREQELLRESPAKFRDATLQRGTGAVADLSRFVL
jgi:hypothetical protein